MNELEYEVRAFCKTNCNKDTSIEEILEDTEKCNFCDLPYIIVNMKTEEKEENEQ